MIFKDRIDAGKQLAEHILQERPLYDRATYVISLIRGGVIISDQLAKILKIKHLPLAVAKIPAPNNPELAIGALCFDIVYLIREVIVSLDLDKPAISQQIQLAQQKFDSYLTRFRLKDKLYNRLKNKTVIIADDGVATGASIRTALLYVKTKKPKQVFLASPVIASDFNSEGFDRVFTLDTDPSLTAISQHYQSFPAVEDEEVKNILGD